jgi:low temperature requirement protein LtrA
MVARDRDEPHRAATPLELLFDLCFVVAVSQVAAELRHGLADAHVGQAIVGYLMVFFAIWWAWMNFTWFASAYDTDDVPYRVLTLVQISGVLVLAAGVPAAFEHYDFVTVTIGYSIMRVPMILQWLRAAAEHPEGRPAALRFAVGIGVTQLGWIARLALPDPWGWIGFLVLVAMELAVPVWAERSRPTAWHPEHIAERYGLFTLIVLGECVLASTVAVQSAIADHGLSAGLLVLAAGGLLLVFGLWWSYFKRPAHEGLRVSPRSAFIWGYGHYFVFGSAAALGAGLEVAAETIEHATELGEVGAAFAVAVPVAIYLLVVGALQTRMNPGQPVAARFAVVAVLVLLAAAGAAVIGLPAAVLVMGLLVTVLISIDVFAAQRALSRAARLNR